MTTRPRLLENPVTPAPANLVQLSQSLQTAHSRMEDLLTQLGRLHSDVRTMTDAVLKHTEAVSAAVLRAEAIAMRSEAKPGTRAFQTDLRSEINALRLELKAEFVAMRMETATRFGTVDQRFDVVETVCGRIERDLGGMRVDILRIEDGLIAAQQAALQKTLKLAETTS